MNGSQLAVSYWELATGRTLQKESFVFQNKTNSELKNAIIVKLSN